MTEWKLKRFWTEARPEPAEGGFTVTLDGRPVKTPAKAALTVPTRAMAEAMAAEWDAQQDAVDPRTMPVTRAANAAIDKVAVQHGRVAEMLAEYGGTDLLCYRAEAPAELVARQEAAWDPLLAWARDALDAPLVTTRGVMHVPQPERSLQAFDAQVRALDPFALTALHDLVTLSGSLVIGLAAIHEHLPAGDLWQRSRIDEIWQEEQWGADEEAAEAARRKETAFHDAAIFFGLCAGTASRAGPGPKSA